jgi:hypothetical protein
MMHLLLTVSARRYEENAKRLAEQDRTWVWPEAEPAFDPDVVRCDLSVGRATCALAVEEVVAILRQLIA